jgi:hypothetical protein
LNSYTFKSEELIRTYDNIKNEEIVTKMFFMKSIIDSALQVHLNKVNTQSETDEIDRKQ